MDINEITKTRKDQMFLLDWFAGMAMSGMHAADTAETAMSSQKKAQIAYEQAEEMLRKRHIFFMQKMKQRNIKQKKEKK